MPADADGCRQMPTDADGSTVPLLRCHRESTNAPVQFNSVSRFQYAPENLQTLQFSQSVSSIQHAPESLQTLSFSSSFSSVQFSSVTSFAFLSRNLSKSQGGLGAHQGGPAVCTRRHRQYENCRQNAYGLVLCLGNYTLVR